MKSILKVDEGGGVFKAPKYPPPKKKKIGPTMVLITITKKEKEGERNERKKVLEEDQKIEL